MHNFQPSCSKVWVNCNSFRHKLLAVVHIKVVLQSQSKLEVFSHSVTSLKQIGDIREGNARAWDLAEPKRRQTKKRSLEVNEYMRRTVDLSCCDSWLAFLYKVHLNGRKDTKPSGKSWKMWRREQSLWCICVAFLLFLRSPTAWSRGVRKEKERKTSNNRAYLNYYNPFQHTGFSSICFFSPWKFALQHFFVLLAYCCLSFWNGRWQREV